MDACGLCIESIALLELTGCLSEKPKLDSNFFSVGEDMHGAVGELGTKSSLVLVSKLKQSMITRRQEPPEGTKYLGSLFSTTEA